MFSKFISIFTSGVKQLQKDLENNKDRLMKPSPLVLWEPTVVENSEVTVS
jgi:hypothetical protein